MSARAAWVALLAVAVVASALAVVYSQHRARERFAQLQALKQEQAQLETQWGRLQLEQSTWAMHGRIERIAREELDMRLPDFERARIVVVR